MPIRAELRHFYRTPSYREARARCFERAGHKCEDCGLRNGIRGYRTRDGQFHRVVLTKAAEPYLTRKLVTVQLSAAHLNHVAGDDRPENLRALCRRDHLLYDQAWHAQTRATRKDKSRPILQLISESDKYQETACLLGKNAKIEVSGQESESGFASVCGS